MAVEVVVEDSIRVVTGGSGLIRAVGGSFSMDNFL
jgi:hypothetical protein